VAVLLKLSAEKDRPPAAVFSERRPLVTGLVCIAFSPIGFLAIFSRRLDWIQRYLPFPASGVAPLAVGLALLKR
jgi:hypothetical protein